MPNHWILKTEPSDYSFAQLRADRTTRWDGISNAAALKHLREVAKGDELLIYHTGDERALVGRATVTRAAYPDPNDADPKQVVIDIAGGMPLPRAITLAEIKADPAFADLALVRQGRLSVVPVPPSQWRRLLQLAGAA
jgi:predicted RNA-binding protein with PUA-like domain